MKILILISTFVCINIIGIDCHGRLIDPPARSSAWRENPVSFPYVYYDNQMFCGGFETQWKKNKGRCGICGEDWSKPRLFEKGGELYRGISVRTYNQGETIEVKAEITANHQGFMEYRICNVDKMANGEANQKCLNENLLRDKSGRSRFAVRPGVLGNITSTIVLPKKMVCDHCVIQWRYHAANSWNTDPFTRKGCVGCGPQEEFYGCADVKIVKSEEKREPTDLLNEDEESKNLLVNLLEKLKKLKEEREKGINEETREPENDDIIADFELQIPHEKREKIVYPNEPIPEEEFGREFDMQVGVPIARDQRDNIIYPDELRPSEEFPRLKKGLPIARDQRNKIIYSKIFDEEVDRMAVGEPIETRDTFVYPDEPRPSEEFGRGFDMQVGIPIARDQRDNIIFPDEPRPSEQFQNKRYANLFEKINSVFPDEPRPSEEFPKRKLINLLKRIKSVYPDEPRPIEEFKSF
ncbi:unnamed protein product [Brachionus calyciflorus]|uniref:Chitin-binding type-4 domain-containing protein n=1 Tax=Brachionus calyciflorus TaxID=104777 RepID=A0A814EGP1_9BILA|nr:unnamed protein product [Brachionus calyciflorus]